MREEEEGQKTIALDKLYKQLNGHAAQLLKKLDPD